jgi:hypothetical protein
MTARARVLRTDEARHHAVHRRHGRRRLRHRARRAGHAGAAGADAGGHDADVRGRGHAEPGGRAGWDALMRRTASRPLPAGTITRVGARFGWALSALRASLSLAFLPWLDVALPRALPRQLRLRVHAAQAAHAALHAHGRHSGALPVLAGWTATGQPIDVTALALTGVLFMWQIPHFLAIGWMAREDYRRPAARCSACGGVRAGERARLAAYAVAMLVCAAVVGMTSAGRHALHGSVAVLAGGAYVAFAWRFVQQRERAPARRDGLFFSSLHRPAAAARPVRADRCRRTSGRRAGRSSA